MPARKPSSLIQRHETAAEKAQRSERESQLRPERSLPMAAPARLDGHEIAQAAWRRMMRTYAGLEGEVVTRLDQELLLNYCMLVEQLAEIDTMRKTAYAAWLLLAKAHEKLVEAGQFDDAVLMAVQVVGAFDAVLRLDGRADRKRDLLHKYSQSLYLTPRARAGTAPAKKEQEPPPDELEQLLDDVTDFVNGEGHA